MEKMAIVYKNCLNCLFCLLGEYEHCLLEVVRIVSICSLYNLLVLVFRLGGFGLNLI